MVSSPEDAASPPTLGGLRARLEERLGQWPPALSEPIRLRRGAGSQPSHAAAEEPYWLDLPRWLLAGFPDSIDVAFLDPVLWGQFCLFRCVRLQDDLFDGQAESSSTVFASQQLLIEAERAFAQCVPTESGFWSLFRDSLETTTRAIVEVDRLQRDPGGMDASALGLYAGVAQVLKLGSQAVCRELGREDVTERVDGFCDHLAIAGQVLDDLIDLGEDLDRSRFNFAAARLVPDEPAEESTLDSIRASLARSLSHGSGVERVLSVSREHLRAAGEIIAPLNLAGAERFVREELAGLETYARRLHEHRFKLLFG